MEILAQRAAATICRNVDCHNSHHPKELFVIATDRKVGGIFGDISLDSCCEGEPGPLRDPIIHSYLL